MILNNSKMYIKSSFLYISAWKSSLQYVGEDDQNQDGEAYHQNDEKKLLAIAYLLLPRCEDRIRPLPSDFNEGTIVIFYVNLVLVDVPAQVAEVSLAHLALHVIAAICLLDLYFAAWTWNAKLLLPLPLQKFVIRCFPAFLVPRVLELATLEADLSPAMLAPQDLSVEILCQNLLLAFQIWAI